MREASCSRAAASAALVFAAIAWARFTAKAFFSARADRILCRFRCASSARLASTESRLFFESSCTCRFWRACSVRSEKLFARSFRVRSAASARRAAFASRSRRASAEISDAVRSRRRRGGEEGSSKGVGVLAMLITMEVMNFLGFGRWTGRSSRRSRATKESTFEAWRLAQLAVGLAEPPSEPFAFSPV